MNNVHRLHDLEHGMPQRNNDQQQPFLNQNLPFINQASSHPIPPRSETFFQMLQLNFCPSFSLCRFLVLISILDLLVFLLTVLFSSQLGPQFLQPDPSTLVSFGAKYPYSMRYNYQIQRFLTPILLHGGFMHLFSNTVSQMVFGLPLERTLGFSKTAQIYVISGFGGYLISALASDSLSVGASGCILGVLGCFFAYFIKNWDELQALGPIRYMYLCFLFFLVIFNFSGEGKNNNIDGWGHFGGLLTGLLAGLVIVQPIFNGDWQKKTRLFGGLGLIVMLPICFICFYTVREPQALF